MTANRGKADFIDQTVLGLRNPLKDAEKFDSLMAPNRETRCKRSQNVVQTREETLKLVNSPGVATSKVSESPSCFFMCSLCRVSCKRTPERFPLSLEVF